VSPPQRCNCPAWLSLRACQHRMTSMHPHVRDDRQRRMLACCIVHTLHCPTNQTCMHGSVDLTCWCRVCRDQFAARPRPDTCQVDQC
jgi:hypothetical protein